METSQNTHSVTDYKPAGVLALADQLEKQPAKKFDFTTDPLFAVWLSNSLQLTAYDRDVVAISAPQVGFDVRAFYIKGFVSAFFNPVIIDVSSSESYMEEASISFPNLVVKIKRPDVIRVRWTDALNNTETHVYNGLTARVIQRKMDFLDGVPFYDHATKYHRDQAFKRMKNSDDTRLQSSL